MLENDAQLIRSVLLGDDAAFGTLVQRYQKGVHALVRRTIGDYHHAEEITQDTFIKAYGKLSTLRDPHHFSGWLYVIAKRLSLNWIQREKPKLQTQSLEDTSVGEIEETSYQQQMSEQRETATAERRSEVVKELLDSLPESERTVVTLYYMGEMTTKQIGNFLGVSVNTIKSRLRRGRERLQASESVVRNVLGSLSLSSDLTERVLRDIADINPISPPAGKPVVPWAALGAATVTIVLLLGVGNQYLAHFQRPYSFEADSEPTVELVDNTIVVDFISKPTHRRQFGSTLDSSENTGGSGNPQVSPVMLSTDGKSDDRPEVSTVPWTQGYGPPGGHVRDIFTTSQGSVYAVASTGVYQLAADATAWKRLKAGPPIVENALMPMTESDGRVYIVSTDEIFASTDNGETWQPFCPRPKGFPVALIVTDETDAQRSQSDMTMYVALRDEGIFRWTPAGRRWDALPDGLRGERITAIGAVGTTVFAGTNRGLYRLESRGWKKLPVGASKAVYSLAVLENYLYVGMGVDLEEFDIMDSSSLMDARAIVTSGEPTSGRIFRSVDLGASWTEITPEYRPSALPSGIRLLVSGETLFALGATNLCSTDRGNTWTSLGIDRNLAMLSNYPTAAVNGTTFYKAGAFGIHRTTDSGQSWHIFMDGMQGTRVNTLIAFNNRLYAHTDGEVYHSTHEGVSWEKVGIGAKEVSRPSVEKDSLKRHAIFTISHKVLRPSVGKDSPYIYADLDAKFVSANGSLYFISPEKKSLRIFRLSGDDDRLIPVQVTPDVDSEVARQSVSKDSRYIEAFTMSGDMFYAEYKRRLFKWKLGDSEWRDTGVVDLGEASDDEAFKLAVSGETVYVGKRDGYLFQSRDAGHSWRDVTPNLPLDFARFNEITFAGSTVYVATDKGVLTSANGEYWHVIRDRKNGKPIRIHQLAVAGAAVYGAGESGVYHLETHGHWEQMSAEIPNDMTSLTLLNNRLYGVVPETGLFHMSLTPTY